MLDIIMCIIPLNEVTRSNNILILFNLIQIDSDFILNNPINFLIPVNTTLEIVL